MNGRVYRFETRDVEYLAHAGEPLLARLYQPMGEGPFPAVVDVHGGGWTGGGRLDNKAINEALASASILVMAVDFRMPPKAPYPASIADVNFAIRWLKAHAKELHTREDLIGGLGASSGGHQMMLAALLPDDRRFAGLPHSSPVNARLAFAVMCWGVLDPVARYRMVQERDNKRLVEAHLAYFGSEAVMAEGSPQAAVEGGRATHLPPTLLLQGTADENLTPDMADRFAVAYRSAGGVAEVHKFEGQAHSFVNKDPQSPAALKAIGLMREFILRQAAPGQ